MSLVRTTQLVFVKVSFIKYKFYVDRQPITFTSHSWWKITLSVSEISVTKMRKGFSLFPIHLWIFGLLSRCIYPNSFLTLGGYIKINLICVPKQYARKKQPDIFVLPANTDHILFIKWVVTGPKCTYCHTSFCHSLLLLLSFLFAFFIFVRESNWTLLFIHMPRFSFYGLLKY